MEVKIRRIRQLKPTIPRRWVKATCDSREEHRKIPFPVYRHDSGKPTQPSGKSRSRRLESWGQSPSISVRIITWSCLPAQYPSIRTPCRKSRSVSILWPV